MMRLTQLLKKTKKKGIKLMITLFCVLLLSACISNENGECLIDYPKDFKTRDSPIIHITGVDSVDRDHCIYSIDLNIWFKESYISSRGKLYSDSEAFYLMSINPATEYVKYFDFSKSVGDHYDISLKVNNQKHLINASVEKIVDTENKSLVHVFRFKNTFYYEYKAYDTVILASITEGILGSYFSSYYNNEEYMLSPAGDILEDYIDYSKMELRTLR